MHKRKLWKRALPVILSVAMVFQSAPATAMAAEGSAPQEVEQAVEAVSELESAGAEETDESKHASTEEADESEITLTDESESETASETESESEPFSINLPDEIPFEIDATDIYAGINQSDADLNAVDVNAAVYDPRVTAPGTVTSVKDQSPNQTCWAFATTAIMESSMILQGLADNSIDLSERHLAYFSYNTGCDRLGNASDDSIVTDPARTYLAAAGNTFTATLRMMNWHGMASEADYPYQSLEPDKPIPAESAQDVAALAHNVYFIPTNTATTEQKKAVIKEMIVNYGSVAWSYGHGNEWIDWDTGAYYNPNPGTNHEITIVGWDDTFSKDKFTTTPEGDGAWIVKNSWGTWLGDEGYIYISYYDASLGSGNAATVAVACATDTYDNNYFYGNTSSYSAWYMTKTAQVFEAKGSTGQEQLTAVSMLLGSDKADYTIQVYRNPELVNGAVADPESGERMLDEPATGTTGYAGLYTIDLPEPVTFSKGDYISIVISFAENEVVQIDTDEELEEPLFDGTGTYSTKLTNTTHPGQSFYYDNGEWIDGDWQSFSTRINALTVNINGSGEEDVRYKVTFLDADDNVINTQTVRKGGSAVAPVAPMRESYVFRDWSGSYHKITADTTLKALYDPIAYTITYELGGGVNAETNPVKYTIESETVILQAPHKDNKIFGGWYDNSDFSGQRITEIPQGSAGDLTLYARWYNPEGLWMTDIDDQVYTGKAVKPEDFMVYDGDTVLTKGVDYKVSYKYNVNANTDGGTKVPSIIIKGKGNYSGTVTKTFRILPVDLSETQIDDIAVAYKTSAQKPKPVVSWNGKKLTLNKDYVLDATSAKGYKDPDTYIVTVSGKGNFTGEKSFQFIIKNQEQKLISKVKKTKIPNQEYKGEPIIITTDMLALTDGTYTLVKDTDYTLEYGACIDAGTYSVLIRGCGKYQGVVRTSFKILGTDIRKTTASWQEEYTYNGMKQEPKPVITDKTTRNPLTEGEHYRIVSYSNNISAGTAKVTVKGIGTYSGTTTYSFKIKAANASGLTVTFANGSKDQPYEKGGVKPEPIVQLNGITMTAGTDYTVSYKNNTAYPEKAGKKPTVVIKGKKNLTGTKNEEFNIVPRDISDISETGLLLLPDVAYNSKPGRFYTKPQLFDHNGKKLVAGTDYEKVMLYTDASGAELDNTKTPQIGDVITVTITGKGAYDKTITGTYRIIQPKSSIASAKVKVNKKFYYTGKDIMLTKEDLTVTLNKAPVTDYRLVPYPNNPRRGQAKFLLVGEGACGGQKTITITILPQIFKWWDK